MISQDSPKVLQFCHGYDGPFLDCARQYAALFDGTSYKVTTVFLTGKKDAKVAQGCHSDEVIFLEHSSASVRGLKLKAIRDLRHIAREREFAFCIAHRSKPTYIACLATDLPVIGVHHAFGDFERLGRKLFARAFRKRLHLLAVSKAVREDIQRCLPDWPETSLHTLYNRIDLQSVEAEQLGREAARLELGLSADSWVVANVGRLHPDKDQATLLRGFAMAEPQLPARAVLLVIGAGRLEKALRDLAVELGIDSKVCFSGPVPNARRLFKAFDLFALTSDHEPFGMVLLEAMAAGVPLICSDCGGGAEVVRGIGRLFPFKDERALADCLIAAARMDQADIREQQNLMMNRLTADFSDAAAKSHFWSLPGIKQFK
ncbi:MAG: glycosyltransferase [Gammaproteobacteria bacterium HGW-Gammaproteobacteria-11]|nr:MAG: glycosyltransferase [Gammaproteobacteria bacterium HGW-Gammaproteobacteria-11]